MNITQPEANSKKRLYFSPKNRRLIQDRIDGLSLNVLARKYGISNTRVTNILKLAKEREMLP
jgi:Mor family transcriptional regulator